MLDRAPDLLTWFYIRDLAGCGYFLLCGFYSSLVIKFSINVRFFLKCFYRNGIVIFGAVELTPQYSKYTGCESHNRSGLQFAINAFVILLL